MYSHRGRYTCIQIYLIHTNIPLCIDKGVYTLAVAFAHTRHQLSKKDFQLLAERR